MVEIITDLWIRGEEEKKLKKALGKVSMETFS